MKSILIGVCVYIGIVAVYLHFADSDSQWLQKARFLGDRDSRSVVVYLHGMDPLDMSEQELDNRQKLHDIGKSLSVKFYMPRSVNRCKNNDAQLCWPQENIKDLEDTFANVTSIFNQKKTDEIKGIVGFSDGGYFTGKVIQNCLISDDFWLVSISSAGSWRETTKDLSICGEVTSLIGVNDQQHYSDMIDFHSSLLSAGAKSKLVEFEGGHEIPQSELKAELDSLLVAKR